MYDIANITGTIFLGNQGEDGVTVITIDCSAFEDILPGGAAAVTYVAGEGIAPAAIPVDQATLSDSVLTIRVLGNMTATPGIGSLVVRWVNGTGVKKTAVLPTYVAASHPAASADLPPTVQDWVDAATAKLATLHDGANGLPGADGASIVSGVISGDDIVFAKDDETTVTLTGAVTTLTGPAGADGAQGAQGVQGPAGAAGADGAQGPQGVAGADGAAGTSAYAQAQAGGYNDTESNFLLDLAAIKGLAAGLAAL